MDSFVEEVVLREDQKDDQRHVDVVIATAWRSVQGLKNRDDQPVNISGGQHVVVEALVLVEQQVEQQGGLVCV